MRSGSRFMSFLTKCSVAILDNGQPAMPPTNTNLPCRWSASCEDCQGRIREQQAMFREALRPRSRRLSTPFGQVEFLPASADDLAGSRGGHDQEFERPRRDAQLPPQVGLGVAARHGIPCVASRAVRLNASLRHADSHLCGATERLRNSKAANVPHNRSHIVDVGERPEAYKDRNAP